MASRAATRRPAPARTAAAASNPLGCTKSRALGARLFSCPQTWEGGLEKRNRHHVHLTDLLATAWETGRRHRNETALVLRVESGRMAREGWEFYRSENGVWHVDAVPLAYLSPVR